MARRSSRPPLKRTRVVNLQDGIYHIVNVFTGAYLALLNDDDRSEVVTVTFGLLDEEKRGTQVRAYCLLGYESNNPNSGG